MHGRAIAFLAAGLLATAGAPAVAEPADAAEEAVIPAPSAGAPDAAEEATADAPAAPSPPTEGDAREPDTDEATPPDATAESEGEPAVTAAPVDEVAEAEAPAEAGTGEIEKAAAVFARALADTGAPIDVDEATALFAGALAELGASGSEVDAEKAAALFAQLLAPPNPDEQAAAALSALTAMPWVVWESRDGRVVVVAWGAGPFLQGMLTSTGLAAPAARPVQPPLRVPSAPAAPAGGTAMRERANEYVKALSARRSGVRPGG